MAGLVARLLFVSVVLGGLLLAGCGGPSEPPEPQADVTAANTAGAQWTPQQKEEFKAEMKGHAMTVDGQAHGKK